MKFGLFTLLTIAAAGIVSAQPVIRSSNGVLNANGYQAQLAPDTVFVVFGTGLGPAAIQEATAPNYPAMLGGTSVNFIPSSGGTAIPGKMVYTLATQIAGVLPSSITPGTYLVTVSYQGQTSPGVSVTVVARSLGIATSNSGGTGAAQATIGNVNNGISLARMTTGTESFGGYDWTLSPAHPGDEIVLWGTGGGADPANDTGGSSGDQTAAGNFTVSVDGTPIVPLYSGTSSGYPGLWQVNFVLPMNISPDCFASVTVTGGGQVSNPVTIGIAQTGQSSCSTVISPATLAKLDSGTGTVTMAGLNIGQLEPGAGTQGTVGGVINQYSVAEFLLPFVGPKVGSCTILQETYPAGAKEPSAANAQLDAGTITISGPNGLAQAVGRIAGPSGPIYNSSVPVAPGGTYTLASAGGPQVGAFSIPTTFPTSFSVSGSLASINRSQPLTVNWTGSGFNQVLIDITTQIQSSVSTQSVTVTCVLPASMGTYTIPAAALAYLIPSPTVASFQVTADNNNGGLTSAESTTDPNTVIPLVSGGLVDFGGFGPYIDYSVSGVTVH